MFSTKLVFWVAILVLGSKTRKAQGFDLDEVVSNDLLLDSLTSYCTTLMSDPTVAKYVQKKASLQPLSIQDITAYTKIESIHNTRGFEPTVLPTEALLQRENGKIWIMFQVEHSDPAVISRVDAFHFQKVILKIPQDLCHKKIRSKARFGIDLPASLCDGHSTRKEQVATFEFTTLMESNSTVVIHVDLCSFDIKRARKRGHMDTKRRVISETVSLPKLILDPHINEFVSVENGDPPEFEIRVNISPSTNFSVELVLWDWSLNKTLQSSAEIFYSGNHPPDYVIKAEDNRDQLFSLEILKREYDKGFDIKVVLNTTSGQRSGKLLLKYESDAVYVKNYVNVVRKTGIERTVYIKLEGKPNVFPKDLVYLNKPHRRFLCDENGDKTQEMDTSFRNKCTVRCQAIGPGISNIYITKMEPAKSHAVSGSYVLPNKAAAILDVGPTSGDVEGEYECVAVDSQGRTRTKKIELYTSLLTKITSFDLISTNENATITCSYIGTKDLDVSIVVSDKGMNHRRLDTDERYKRIMEPNGDNKETKLILNVPWKDLTIPRDHLLCQAEGERGADSKTIRLSRFHQNTVGFYTKIEEDLFKGKRVRKNNSVTISCTATGEQPIDMWMSTEFISGTGGNPIKSSFRGVTTNIKRYPDKVVLTAKNIPYSHFYSYLKRIYCKAKNKYNSDQEWFLPKYDF